VQYKEIIKIQVTLCKVIKKIKFSNVSIAFETNTQLRLDAATNMMVYKFHRSSEQVMHEHR
jgi:hypothetical protein